MLEMAAGTYADSSPGQLGTLSTLRRAGAAAEAVLSLRQVGVATANTLEPESSPSQVGAHSISG